MSDQTFGRAARLAWDDMHREPVKRYSVWHTTGKRDGDKAFDDLDDAIDEFDLQAARSDVSEVALFDNAEPDNPKTIRRR